MSTTVLLLSVDEAAMLEHSLPAALAQGPGVEVVVIDNASTDRTEEVTRRHGARRLWLEHRLSYAAAINTAIEHTEGDAVLLLNADCVLEPGFLACAVARLGEDGVGSVAPKLLRAGGPGRPLGEIDAAGMYVDRRRKNGLTGFGQPSSDFDRPGAVFGADGAAALYRREALADCALGGREVLDEDMALWASDADLAWRAQLLGWRCAYEPGAVAHHVRTYSPATRARMSQEARRVQFRNRYVMMIKNETAVSLLRHGLLIAGWELLALGHVLVRERHLLGAYRDAWRQLPAARQRRQEVQRRRRMATAPFGLKAPV